MYNLDEIKVLHMEMTEKCQAACPLCSRTAPDGSVNPSMKNAEITISQARQFFSNDFVKQLNKMYMCGVYGDPIMARDTIEVLEHFRYKNKTMNLGLHTNGGARTADWWKDLAYVMHNRDSHVTFSIDGLKDTNHIYRKNVNWDIVMNSASAFIKAGGNALWSFIVFQHNEHQVEEAEKLAKKMGFFRFQAKKSSRFVDNKVSRLLPPTNEKYQNINLKTTEAIIEKHGSLPAFYDQTEISCMVKQEKNVYVSARGFVFPCCWLADIHHAEDRDVALKQRRDMFGNGESIDLNRFTLEEIFESGIFKKIESTWSYSSTDKGKPISCARTCSKEYNFFKAQFT